MSTMGGEDGYAGSAISSIASGLGRMSSIGGGMLKSRLSSMGGGFARLTSKFGMPMRVARADAGEEEREAAFWLGRPRRNIETAMLCVLPGRIYRVDSTG